MQKQSQTCDYLKLHHFSLLNLALFNEIVINSGFISLRKWLKRHSFDHFYQANSIIRWFHIRWFLIRWFLSLADFLLGDFFLGGFLLGGFLLGDFLLGDLFLGDFDWLQFQFCLFSANKMNQSLYYHGVLIWSVAFFN